MRLRPAATVQIDGNWYSLAKHIVCARGVELAVTRRSTAVSEQILLAAHTERGWGRVSYRPNLSD